MSSYKISVNVTIKEKRRRPDFKKTLDGSNKRQKLEPVMDVDNDDLDNYSDEVSQKLPPKDKEEANSSNSSDSSQEEEEEEEEEEEYVPNQQRQTDKRTEEREEREEREEIPVLPDRFVYRGSSVEYEGRTYTWHPERVILAQYYKPKSKIVKRTVNK